MKAYDLKVRYTNGEIDDYYTRLTGGKGWESDQESCEAVLEEMRETDPETFQDLDDNHREYWVEEIAGAGRKPTATEMLQDVERILCLNQKELGVYIGVSTRTINSWMTGERSCPDYVAEMALRLAEVEAEALDAGDPAPTGMYRWAVISSYGTDEFLTVCGSKADAFREAETQWSHLTEAEKDKAERFEVGLINVQICDRIYASRFGYLEKNGVIDGDVYELGKDFLK